MVTDEYSDDFFVSFSDKGEPLDYLAFKGAYRELIDGKRIYNKYYSYFYYIES